MQAIGNIIYIMLPLNIITPKYMMMISRAVMGTGGGTISFRLCYIQVSYTYMFIRSRK